MTRFMTMKRLSILFAGLFAVLVSGTLMFQHFWVDPGTRCERQGNWYDLESRTCATPIYIPDLTGRPEGMTRAEFSAQKNRELVGLEAEVSRQKLAVREQVTQQRQDLDNRP